MMEISKDTSLSLWERAGVRVYWIKAPSPCPLPKGEVFTTRAMALLVLTTMAVSACNRSPAGPETVAVTGVVTRNGSPVEGANVIFYPAEGSESPLASQAVTDKDGRFELSTHVGGKFKPGIRPGKYTVAVSKPDVASVSSTLAPPKNLLPKKYADAKTSGLVADVAAGKANQLEFALSGE
jgi:hypothetical protein